jgi:Cysteine-rich CPCC
MPDTAAPIYPCPACGFTVFHQPYGSSDTCPVCGWVNDLVQLAQPDFVIGANPGLSLRRAQSGVLAIYPIAVRAVGTFSRDSRWRPLSLAEYPSTGSFTLASPVCYLTAPDPEMFEPYWLNPPPVGDQDT